MESGVLLSRMVNGYIQSLAMPDDVHAMIFWFKYTLHKKEFFDDGIYYLG